MISAIIIMAFVLVVSISVNFALADINNKLDLTNEDLMEENEVLREKIRTENTAIAQTSAPTAGQ